MSKLDEIRKLEKQRLQLVADAKEEALGQINNAIKMLSELGFAYELIEKSGTRGASPVKRRAGIRDAVLRQIKDAGRITRADLLVAMNVKGDKSGEQSVSNALAALRRAGTVSTENGTYKAI